MIPNFDCSKRSFKNEAGFQTFLTTMLRKNGWFVYKIPDQSMGYKPYDCITAYKHGTFHVEVKYQALRDSSFYKAKIRPTQHASLSQISEFNPESALMVIYVAEDKKYYTYTYLDLMKKMKGLKSIKLRLL